MTLTIVLSLVLFLIICCVTFKEGLVNTQPVLKHSYNTESKKYIEHKQLKSGELNEPIVPKALEKESTKKPSLKKTSLKVLENSPLGWCKPYGNGKWFIQTKENKCITQMGGKAFEVDKNEGRCIQNNTMDDCKLTLQNLEKDIYWHKHPLLMSNKKVMGIPASTKFI